MIQQFSFWVIPKRVESRETETYLCTHVHRSIMHNSQKVKATQLMDPSPSTDEWVNKKQRNKNI